MAHQERLDELQTALIVIGERIEFNRAALSRTVYEYENELSRATNRFANVEYEAAEIDRDYVYLGFHRWLYGIGTVFGLACLIAFAWAQETNDPVFEGTLFGAIFSLLFGFLWRVIEKYVRCDLPAKRLRAGLGKLQEKLDQIKTVGREGLDSEVRRLDIELDDLRQQRAAIYEELRTTKIRGQRATEPEAADPE